MTYYPFEFNKNMFLIVCSNETMNISVSHYPSLELKMQIPVLKCTHTHTHIKEKKWSHHQINGQELYLQSCIPHIKQRKKLSMTTNHEKINAFDSLQLSINNQN